MKVNKTLDGLTQSIVENLVNCNSKNPKLLTIFRICDGLGITLKEFFGDDIFLKLDREDLLLFFLLIINHTWLLFYLLCAIIYL